jgi:hypothetical protein
MIPPPYLAAGAALTVPHRHEELEALNGVCCSFKFQMTPKPLGLYTLRNVL